MIDTKVVFMFSGQGCQYFQMGRPLFERHAGFRTCMQRMDDIVLDLSGYSVLRTLYDRGYTASNTFDRTLLSHPAIFMVEYATARVLMDAGIVPYAALGASLGSFAAAAVAGCLQFEEALIAVVRQAAMIEVSCRRGGMIAILDSEQLFEESELHLHSEVASVNWPTHFVVSATHENVARIERFLRARGVAHQRLPVSFPFHSRWIDEARQPFQDYLRALTFGAAEMPLVCSMQGTVLTSLPPNYLWSVVREPICFHRAIASLEGAGAHRYIDVGPMPSLSNLAKYLLDPNSGSTTRTTLSPFDSNIDNINALIAENS